MQDQTDDETTPSQETDPAAGDQDMTEPNDDAPPPPPEWDGKLTAREAQVAFRLAHGDKNAEIADLMDISVKTVDTHRAHVLKKLEVRNNVELARLAIRRGWVTV